MIYYLICIILCDEPRVCRILYKYFNQRESCVKQENFFSPILLLALRESLKIMIRVHYD